MPLPSSSRDVPDPGRQKLIVLVAAGVAVGAIAVGAVAGDVFDGTPSGPSDGATAERHTSKRQHKRQVNREQFPPGWHADAIDQAHEIQACLREAGYIHLSQNGRDNGVRPVTTTREDWPVVHTGLKTKRGFYSVGISPTKRYARGYLDYAMGAPGGGEFRGSYDGSVTLVSGGYRSPAASAAERTTVADCAFSVAAAPGTPTPAPH